MSYNYILFNGIVFCVVNVIFLFVGSFFNVVVVFSIWKSSQLRKKLCYFMIFLLSCYDLVVVIVLHFLAIFWYISWFLKGGSIHTQQFRLLFYISGSLFGCSLFGLLTMTLERYLGLAYPLFHKTSVTKRRLAIFLLATQTFTVLFHTVTFIFKISTIIQPYAMVFVGVFLILVVALNCKMFYIAKSRHKTPSSNGKRGIFEYKKYYTCLLAVVLFFICCCPTLIYCGLILLNILDRRSTIAVSLFFWASTMVTINSTVNAVIFFWINNVLRCEGKKLLKRACAAF